MMLNVKKIELQGIKERQEDQVIYNAVAITADGEQIACYVLDEGYAYRVSYDEITIEDLYDTETYQSLEDVPEWVEIN